MKIQNDYMSTEMRKDAESHPRREKSTFAFRKG